MREILIWRKGDHRKQVISNSILKSTAIIMLGMASLLFVLFIPSPGHGYPAPLSVYVRIFLFMIMISIIVVIPISIIFYLMVPSSIILYKDQFSIKWWSGLRSSYAYRDLRLYEYDGKRGMIRLILKKRYQEAMFPLITAFLMSIDIDEYEDLRILFMRRGVPRKDFSSIMSWWHQI